MRRQVLSLTLCAALGACIDSATAQRDALDAVQNGDCRLSAVRGFSTETPGANIETRQRLGYRVIEGTSDYHQYPWDGEFNRRARDYALNYNRTILERCAS